MKRLYLRICLLFILVMAVSFGLDRYYRTKYQLDYHYPKNILPAPPIATPYQLVKVGNSHSTDGITFEHFNLPALDLSGAGQELRYDLAFLKHHANQIDNNAVIIIPVTPITFSQKRPAKESGLHRIYYGRISPLYLPYFEPGDYLQTELLPFLRAGQQLRDKNQVEITERIADENSRPQEPRPADTATPSAEVTNSSPEVKNDLSPIDRSSFTYSKVSEINLAVSEPVTGNSKRLDDSMHFMYRKWYDLSEYSPEYFEENRRELERIIEYSLSRNWRPILVTIPISEVLEDGLSDDYKQIYIYDNLEKIDSQGIPYWDFSKDEIPRINADLFGNSDHLNQNGARLFSYLLLSKLISEGYLPDSADGYIYD